MSGRPLIFISYSHLNAREQKQLETQLRVLETSGDLDVWTDSRIAAGGDWREEIEQALENARVAVLLITAEFLGSSFIRTEEVPRLLQAQSARGITIIPIIAKDCAWQTHDWLARMQVRPRNGQPIFRSHGRYADRELADIVTEVADVLRRSAPEATPAVRGRRSPSPATPPAPNADPHIFPKSDSAEFVAFGEALLQKAKRIVLIGTGLNLLQRDPIFMDVVGRAARGESTVEVYLADPWSPEVVARLVEEELGAMKPPIGQRGLIQRLTTILDTLDRLQWPRNFALKLFPNYPTFAMFIIDDDYFFYPYGYALLGNFSPVEHFNAQIPHHAPMIDFLQKQYERVRAAAIDARDAHALRHGQRVSPDRLRAFAAYIVPPRESSLYQFGSTVLGYDVRSRRLLESPWAEHVGAASDFGFHLTVADALYFATETEVQRLHHELQLILQSFRPFLLRDLEVVAGFPDERSISLTCSDPTRSLEALHFELMSTAYRRAIASNYTLSLGGRRLVNEPGTELMLQRYGAPYVLSRYRPHFSLLTAVDRKRAEAVAAEVRAFFEENVGEHDLEVGSLALMTRNSQNAPWQIEREIPLR